jgi:hypothetical protein
VSELRFFVTAHALERAKERRLDLTVSRIFYELQRAYQEGRFARNKPRWMVFSEQRPKRRLGKEHGVTRYAWPESEAYCYRLRRQKHPEFGERWVVVTVMPRARKVVA